MAYNALQLIYGIGRGIQGAQQRQREYSRQDYLDSLQQQQLDLDKLRESHVNELGKGELGIRQQEANTAASEFGLRRDQFNKEYEDLIPGGVNIPVGSHVLHLPGRADILGHYAPVFSQLIQEAGANSRQAGELKFRGDHPEAFGGSKRPTTPAEARLQMMKDTFSSPSLAVDPSAYSTVFESAMREGQKYIPELFGSPPVDPTTEWIHGLLQDPRNRTREGFQTAINHLISTDPDTYMKLNREALDSYARSLPRGPGRTAEDDARSAGERSRYLNK